MNVLCRYEMDGIRTKIINPDFDHVELTSLASIWNSTTMRLLLYVYKCLF